ncbi:hypothetical protein M0812_30250 [Anaeramoeba flamelloides]|uniref:Uncharacterized protein n=1 Tax=Anaeramoeba flamelloides TaxID=1746091 RepID=A0AAV7Y592_9EUKA|nr:hypothetical protein M0812_30250 [Anaeramoeba flamelloides]
MNNNNNNNNNKNHVQIQNNKNKNNNDNNNNSSNDDDNNNNKPTTKNSLQKSSEQLILTNTKAKNILKTFNQNNINNLINFFLEKDVSGFYQTNPLLFISNLFNFSQKLSKK